MGRIIQVCYSGKTRGNCSVTSNCRRMVKRFFSYFDIRGQSFFGPDFSSIVKKSIKNNNGATLFAYKVKDPERFGVVDFDKNNNVLSIEEKPKEPKSSWAVTGLYIYNNQAGNYVKNLKKSNRGEYEITDLNRKYLEDGNLKTVLLNKDYSWLDTGTHDSLLEASNFVQNSIIEFGRDLIDLDEL